MDSCAFKALNFAVRVCAAGLLLLLASACTVSPSVTVAVDAISAAPTTAGAEDSRYVLKPMVAGVDDTDLHFLEYAEHIHTALESRGMQPAPSADLANVEIEVNYGASPQQRLVSVPGLQRHRASLTERFCARRDDRGRCRHWRSRPVYERLGLFDRLDRGELRVQSYYRIFVTLEAFDKRDSPQRSPLWLTRARIESSRSDLRAAIPTLLAAASDYIGSDTGREILVTRRDQP